MCREGHAGPWDNPTMKRRVFLAFATMAPLPLAMARGQAQTPPQNQPVRLRGVLDSASADTLDMTTRDGSKVTAHLAANLRVTQMLPARLNDIHADSYIGSAAMAQPDGTLRALQVTIFPPAMRGVGEGHRPWDVVGGSTMTNGTVASMTNGTVGQVRQGEDLVLTVRYAGGEQRILVPEDVPIVTLAPGDKSLLAPGAQIIVNGSRAADGGFTATSVTVGKDGLVPPN